jgi:two-component system, NarL family, sensor histidine kinase DevS
MATLTREQLEDRLAALHRASLELVQDISLDSLLERIAGVACEQAGACYGAVGVLGDNGELVKFITVGVTSEERVLMGHPPVGKGLIGALMHSNKPIRLSKISDDPRNVGFPKNHPDMTSFLGVPILRGDHHLGQIYLTNKIGWQEFTAEDQQVIETLATYAAIAISNANLYNQLVERDQILTQRNEDLALINHLAVTLASSSEDIDQILNKALGQVMDYLSLEVGELYLRQGDSTTLALAHQNKKGSHGLWKNNTFQMGKGMVGMVAQNGQYELITLPDSNGYNLDQQLQISSYHQLACFPLSGRGGVMGVLSVATECPQHLDELDIQFLSAISSWIGTVIENSRLNLQQRRLAILEERERIGMDLHDGVIQSIYAVGLTLEHARLLMSTEPPKALERIVQAIGDLNSTIRDIRAYILDLRPRQLSDNNLMQGIQRLVNEFRANTLIEVSLQGPSDGLVSLPEVQAIALFHICQESLANIAKHAHARHVDIMVWTTAERALVEVHDDGHGFDSENVRLTLGHGLSNMQTRARNVGGDVEISSEPGGGTSVMAWVPSTK